MLFPDVNVLVAALMTDHPHHEACVNWLEDNLAGPEDVGLADVVLTSVVRIATSIDPANLEQTLAFLATVRSGPASERIGPGPRYWEIFTELLRTTGIRGREVSDVALAAMAIEHRATLISFDSDFARYPGLDWRQPLQ